MKWYDISVRYDQLEIEQDEFAHKWPDDGTWCRASDVDRERRRLLVKLLRERAYVCTYQMRSTQSFVMWCEETADALESNQPLTYFQRLGEDK